MTTPFEYVAHLDEAAARRAARAFFVRSILKLRLWRTVLPPIFSGLMTLFVYFTEGNTWQLGLWGTFCIASLTFPAIFYVARPIAAAKFARENPNLSVAIEPAALTLKAQGTGATIPWERFKHVWETDDYLLLVMSPFASINLPKLGMPEGVKDLIVQSVAAANAT